MEPDKGLIPTKSQPAKPALQWIQFQQLAPQPPLPQILTKHLEQKFLNVCDLFKKKFWNFKLLVSK